MIASRYIKHEDGKWNVYSEGGKLLGSHPTEEEAQKQLDAIEAAKAGGREEKNYLPSLEVRSIATEVRMVEVDGKPKIRGYAAVFNSPSEVMQDSRGREFTEVIRPGAFSKALKGADVRGLFNHKPELLLGRKSAGTLQLMEDERGLLYTIDPPNTSTGRDVVELLQRGDLTGSSFSFATVEDNWGAGPDGQAVRELRAVHPFDVGPVTFPAYLQASAAYRSLDAFLATQATPKASHPTPEQRVILQRLQLALLS